MDLGSGQGICASKLNLDKCDYVGVEPSRFLLQRAVELYPQNHFLEGSAYQIPLIDESLDGVFSVAVWHLLKDLELAHGELRRVLKHGGRFLIITADPNCIDEWSRSYDKVQNNEDELIGYKQIGNEYEVSDRIYLHPYDKLKLSLHKSGLKLVTMEKIRIWTLIEGYKE